MTWTTRFFHWLLVWLLAGPLASSGWGYTRVGAPARVGSQVLEEWQGVMAENPVSGSFDLKVRYTYGQDLVKQDRVTSPVATDTADYYGYDGLGSVRVLIQGSGQNWAFGDTYVYDAFGIQLNTPGSTPNNYRYTGEQWDPDLGLYYLRARYYNPADGRFLTMDTFEGNNSDPLSLHKYLYCQGNPVTNTDPSGHESTLSVIAVPTIGAALGTWGAIAANHALGRAQTYSSILLGGSLGAVLGPLAGAVPELGMAMRLYGVAGSGQIAVETFGNPDATPSQKAAAVGLVVASIWGTKAATGHYQRVYAGKSTPQLTETLAPEIPEFPLPLRAPPGITLRSMQGGLNSEKIGQLPGLIKSMLNGEPIPGIGGNKVGNTYYINEGNHRVTAALEIYNKNGDAGPLMKLLNGGNWTSKEPIVRTWDLTQ